MRQIRAEDQELLGQIARSDADARVRRAAVRKLSDPAALAAATQDGDEGVREEAADALHAMAMASDPARGELALAALTDVRRLVSVVRQAPLPAIRQAALSRIGDPRHLATLAKLAEHPAVRLEALRRVEDAALLLDVALKGDHKDVVVAAVDRLEGTEPLEVVAGRARNKAASRRARARLEQLRPAPAPVSVTAEPAAEAEPSAPAEAAASHEAEAAAPEPSLEPATDAPEPAASAAPGASAAPAAEAEGGAVEDDEPAEVPVVAADAEPADAAVEEQAAATEEPAAEAGAAPSPNDEAQAAEREAREQERKEKLAQLEEICGRLEQLGQGSELHLRDAETGLRDLRVAQGGLGGLPAKLAQRIKAVRTALFARLQELREADEWTRWANATVQEELCQRLEGLVGREDLEQVARELRDSDVRWAEARRVPREQAEALRERYQAARGQVRAKLEGYFAQKAQDEAESLKQKEALCERAEALADSTEWLKASEELKALQARWKELGPVPRRQAEAIWKRFRAACDRFFTRRQEDLKHRKEEWAANLVKKEALCTRAEALTESTEWESAAAELRRLQAEWKTVGPVRRNKSEQVWQRFRKACDGFFERYKKRDQLAMAERRGEWEGLIRELEALSPSGADAPEGLAQALQGLQAKARQLPPPPRGDDEDLSRKFQEARDRLIEAHPAAFRGTELDPEANRAKREKLCARIEALLGAETAASAADPQMLSGEDLARRMKEALAARTMGAPEPDPAARRRSAAAEVEAAQAAWKRLGPVPGPAGTALEERFHSACSRVLAVNRPPQRPSRPSGARVSQ